MGELANCFVRVRYRKRLANLVVIPVVVISIAKVPADVAVWGAMCQEVIVTVFCDDDRHDSVGKNEGPGHFS